VTTKLHQHATARGGLWAHIAESHRRQLNGEGFQTVAVEIATAHGIAYESDEYTQLQSMPDPGCECQTCQCFDWDQE
jgi:hypothetical protein